jgi:hypothetical protein
VVVLLVMGGWHVYTELPAAAALNLRRQWVWHRVKAGQLLVGQVCHNSSTIGADRFDRASVVRKEGHETINLRRS